MYLRHHFLRKRRWGSCLGWKDTQTRLSLRQDKQRQSRDEFGMAAATARAVLYKYAFEINPTLPPVGLSMLVSLKSPSDTFSMNPTLGAWLWSIRQQPAEAWPGHCRLSLSTRWIADKEIQVVPKSSAVVLGAVNVWTPIILKWLNTTRKMMEPAGKSVRIFTWWSHWQSHK